MKKKVLIVVAHPDDEIIWMGGTILTNKWDLTIISLCRKTDKDRSPKFKKACEILGARCFISDLEDQKLNDISLEEVIRRIKRCSESYYDYIFTHGKNGEYRHKRHIDVNRAVIEMLRRKMISCRKIFFFCYRKKGKFCYPNKNSDKYLKFKKYCFDKKKELIQNVYGFEKNSFENISCRDKEAFKVVKIV